MRPGQRYTSLICELQNDYYSTLTVDGLLTFGPMPSERAESLWPGGRVDLQGPSRELMNNEHVRTAYLSL